MADETHSSHAKKKEEAGVGVGVGGDLIVPLKNLPPKLVDLLSVPYLSVHSFSAVTCGGLNLKYMSLWETIYIQTGAHSQSFLTTNQAEGTVLMILCKMLVFLST